jgi:hypothetical protein
MSRVGENSVVYIYLLSFQKTLTHTTNGGDYTRGLDTLEILLEDALENREDSMLYLLQGISIVQKRLLFGINLANRQNLESSIVLLKSLSKFVKLHRHTVNQNV